MLFQTSSAVEDWLKTHHMASFRTVMETGLRWFETKRTCTFRLPSVCDICMSILSLTVGELQEYWLLLLDKQLHKLQVLQNQLTKYLYNLPRCYSTNIIHWALDLLKIADLHNYKVLCFVHNCVLNNSPQAFVNYFARNCSLRDCSTLHINPVHPVNALGNTRRPSVNFLGVSSWNKLSNILKATNNSRTCKKITEEIPVIILLTCQQPIWSLPTLMSALLDLYRCHPLYCLMLV